MAKNGLDKWFAQKWVDIGSKKKDGSFAKCGRSKQKADAKRKYPKCVPLAKARRMSEGQRRSAVKRKRAVAQGVGGKPTNVKTFTRKKMADGGYIGSFIDFPMTTYSSGMFGRLSFAVATHISPEILLIDEALSAGDASFREKAVQRLKDVCDSAISIVVVSHSSTLVAEMATEALWLHRGRIRMQGEVGMVTDEYARFQADEKENAQLDQR